MNKGQHRHKHKVENNSQKKFQEMLLQADEQFSVSKNYGKCKK